MKTTPKTLILGAVLGTAILGAESLLAQQPPNAPAAAPGATAAGPQQRNGQRKGRFMAQQLGLTEDQQKKVQELRQSMRSKVEPVRAQLKTKREELQALWNSPNPDRNAILAKTREIQALRNQLGEARVDMRLGMSQFLSPEQREKMKQLREKRGAGGKGRRGRGRGRGQRGQGAEI